jgi:uncharacterized protein YdaU (DUF1376 family)
MSDELPPPLVPADVDLRGLEYMPLLGNHLLGSAFHAMCTDEEWRIGVTLWWASWNQVPAASLPDDDVALTRLADLGRDTKTFKRVREKALHGFVKCSDGRLYHRFLSKQALIAWEKRAAVTQEKSNDLTRKKRERERRSRMFADLEAAGVTPAWNTSTAELSRLHTQHVPKPVTAPVTAQGVTGVTGAEAVTVTGTAKTGRDVTGRDVTSKTTPEAARINPITAPAAETEAAVARASIPPPDLARSPTRRGAVAVILRSGGVSDATQAHPTVVDWAQRGVTDQQLRDAIEIARTRKPSGDIPVAYLKPIVTELHGRPVDAGGSKERDWDFIFGLKERA